MPTYEYACKNCGEHIEVVQSFKDDPLTACPNCGGELRKVFALDRHRLQGQRLLQDRQPVVVKRRRVRWLWRGRRRGRRGRRLERVEAGRGGVVRVEEHEQHRRLEVRLGLMP